MKSLLRGQFRWALLTVLAALIVFLCCFAVVGCSDDTEPMPPYSKILCELITDRDGDGTVIRLDSGEKCHVVNAPTQLKADTIYRITAVVQDLGEEGMALVSAAFVFSPFPGKVEGGSHVTDPVKVLAAWRTDRYYNMRLAVNRGNEATHYMGLVDRGTVENARGIRTKTIELYHDKDGDGEYYDQEFYLSCPIYHYEGQLRRGVDSLRMVVEVPGGKKFVDTVVF